MMSHFIHPIRFYTPPTFFKENVGAKTNGMDKMKANHSGLIHKLMEKLNETCKAKSGIRKKL